jgi:aspartyl-tRNA(Asn)/glutamyl-tRNA(Gln) amidotransferase subunit C
MKLEQIAQLARLELSVEEKEKFEKELPAILEFVEKLKEVDTKSVQPMTGGTELENETRADEQLATDLESRQGEILKQVPVKKDTWVKVKAIFN